MARPYVCIECHEAKTTDSTRGPVPKRCPQCKPQDVRPEHLAGAAPRVPGNKITRRRHLETDRRVHEAIQMRLQYKTWTQIAEALGWNTHTAAFEAVRREQYRRRAMVDESLDEMRERETERLEALGMAALRVLETKHYAVSGGTVVTRENPVTGEVTEMLDDGPALAAVNTLVKVSESLRKLLGLDAATKVDAAVTVKYTIEGIPESEMP